MMSICKAMIMMCVAIYAKETDFPIIDSYPTEKDKIIAHLEAQVIVLKHGMYDKKTFEAYAPAVNRVERLLIRIRTLYPETRQITYGERLVRDKSLAFQVKTDKFRQQDDRRRISDFFSLYPSTTVVFEDYSFDKTIFLNVRVTSEKLLYIPKLDTLLHEILYRALTRPLETWWWEFNYSGVIMNIDVEGDFYDHQSRIKSMTFWFYKIENDQKTIESVQVIVMKDGSLKMQTQK